MLRGLPCSARAPLEHGLGAAVDVKLPVYAIGELPDGRLAPTDAICHLLIHQPFRKTIEQRLFNVPQPVCQ